MTDKVRDLLTSNLEEFSTKYANLIYNVCEFINDPENKDHANDLADKVNLLNREMNDITNRIDEINTQILENKVELTEEEAEELRQAKLSDQMIKDFSPYMLVYQMAHEKQMNDGADASEDDASEDDASEDDASEDEAEKFIDVAGQENGTCTC